MRTRAENKLEKTWKSLFPGDYAYSDGARNTCCHLKLKLCIVLGCRSPPGLGILWPHCIGALSHYNLKLFLKPKLSWQHMHWSQVCEWKTWLMCCTPEVNRSLKSFRMLKRWRDFSAKYAAGLQNVHSNESILYSIRYFSLLVLSDLVRMNEFTAAISWLPKESDH